MAILRNKQNGRVIIDSVDTVNVTVNEYNTDTSILLFTFDGGSNRPSRGEVQCTKTNSTTLTFQKEESGNNVQVEWQLFEFNADVLVQDLQVPRDATRQISSVNLDRSFVITSQMNNRANANDSCWPECTFLSSDKIEVDYSDFEDVQDASIQVVEFKGATVQVSTTAPGATDTSFTSTIDSIDTSKTWIISNGNGGIPGGDFNDGMFRVTITNSTTLTYDRTAAGTLDPIPQVATYIIEHNDGTEVQNGQHTISTTPTTSNVSITAVDPGHSAVILAGMRGPAQSSGQTTNTTDGYDSSLISTRFLTPTQVRLLREGSGSTEGLFWQVIEWSRRGNRVMVIN